VDVLLTDNAGIREINRDYREVDRETDVLSFPMFEFVPGQFPEDVSNLLDPGSDLLPLGDMALSLEKIQAQAQEFGHSQEREIGYLTVHSVLHLLGYDHLDEGEMKRQMREREEAIMSYLNIPR
jgi:probable rRNA maturation factor